MRTIRRFSVFPMAVVMALVGVILYVIVGGIGYGIQIGLYGWSVRDTLMQSMVDFLPGMCIAYLFGIPIAAIGGIIGGWLFAMAYNFAARIFGGIEIEMN